MGNLAAALSEQASAPGRMRCTVGLLLRELDDIDAQALRKAIDSGMEGSRIAAALSSEGHRVAGQAIQRHRRRQCNCGDAS